MAAVWGWGCSVEWMLCRWSRVGTLSQCPWHSGQLPVSGLSQQKGKPAARAQRSLEPSPRAGAGTRSALGKPLPSRQCHCTTPIYTNLSKLITLRRSQLSRKTRRGLSTWVPPTRKEGVGFRPDKPTPQDRGILTQAGEAWHTQHTVGTQPILTNSSLPRFHVTNPTLTLAAHRHPQAEGSLAQRPLDSLPPQLESPGDALAAVGTQETDKTGCLPHPVVALIC